MNGAGCIFDHYGRIPDPMATGELFSSPLEEAVYNNDTEAVKRLIKEGHTISVKLKIGEMTCLEYAAMKGYADMLELLLRESANFKTIAEYFALEDIVQKAYMISKNKKIFFDKEALAEINRYEAACFTAIMYDQPECLEVLINLGFRDPGKHCFLLGPQGTDMEKMSVTQLARAQGHKKCLDVLQDRLPHIK